MVTWSENSVTHSSSLSDTLRLLKGSSFISLLKTAGGNHSAPYQPAASQPAASQPAPYQPATNQFYCEVCNASFDQEFKLINHKNGLVHRNREKALAGNASNTPPAPQFKPSPSPNSQLSQNLSQNLTKDAKSAPPTPSSAEDIEAAIEKLKPKYIEVEDKNGKKKQKLIVPDEWEFCKPCGAHLRTQQVMNA